MGVQITKRIGSLAERLKGEKLEPVMRRISRHLVSSAVGKINGNIPPENAPLTQEVKQGNKTLRDNGQLMASIAPQNGRDWASANTNLKYAKIQQTGGTIYSKGKGLWLPAGAKTRTLMRRYNAQKPAELIQAMKGDGYSFFRTGKVFCAKKKKGEPFALFIIKQSVTIPARPFLYIDEKDEKHIAREIKKAVHEALQGDNP
ncbi:MAG: phage virion morphogenesis protein [Treponema sp.]|nr:phage virion morphogenesis protein [Treponema sp.]